MRSRKLAWFLMLGLLIALAGCGSDGNGGGMTGMPDPPPVDMDALNAAKAAAMTAYEEAKQAVADVEAHKSADMDSYDMAVAKRDEAMAANDKAQEAETVADAQKYRDMARTANMDAMRYADMVTTAAGTAADRAMAAAIAPAIADPDGDGVIVGVGQTGLLKASRPGMAATFMVAAGGAVTVDSNGDADDTAEDYADILGMGQTWNHDGDGGTTPEVARENEFEMQTGAPPMLEGFTGSVHARTKDKVTDTLTVYTNVEPLKAEAYNDYFTAAEVFDAATNPNGRPAVVSAALAADSDDGALTLASGTFTDADNANLFGGSFFVKPPSNTQNALDGDAGSDTDNPANEVDGTFAGVPGKFVCGAGAGSTCTVTFDTDGMLTALSPGWTFVPTSTDVEVQNVIRDTDFLTFGYWLQATEQDDGSTKYGVNTFYTGAQIFTGLASTSADSTVITEVRGTAEYSGKATGMYARKTFDTKGVGTPTSSGQFTADANLMAYFGVDNNVAAIKHNTISGTVSNFKDDSGSMIDDAWTVELDKAVITTDATNGATIGLASTTGGGEWQGAFYGNPMGADGTVTNNNLDTPAAENAPTSVAGEFNAHFSNGHVIGAFGATKE